MPTKLAEWIGENMQEELGFPDKADKRAEPGTGWTPAELNSILHDHVVAGELTTFGCVEWESQLFRGTMRARCYPFNMPKRRFHGFNPKVSVYTFILDVYTSIYVHIRSYTLFRTQDTVVVVPPYPYCIEEDCHAVPLEDCWYTRQQLFFKCYLRPKYGRQPRSSIYKAGPGIYYYILVYRGIS